ncbi:MAG: phytanoyl-CoA dioxygenase family protein [Actinomycetota bacterium]|nr:phytanoyl-CoA dioxygenase family protein [Actinomycetota bacterium]MED5362456.1 phytanoyl-CoA dioxygenase family protein [Actinomycetota bacterium]
MRVLNDSEVAAFRSDGVVHIRDAVDPELVAAILESVEDLIDSPGRFGGSMTPDNEPGKFFQDRYLHPTRSDFRSYATDCGLAASAAKATGSTKMRLYYDHVFVKEPGTQELFVWHQDRPYWAVDGTQICSSWLALTDATTQSSGLEFVQGSHLWDRTFKPEYPALEGAPPEQVEKALWKGVAQHIQSFDDECPAFEEFPDLYNILSFDVAPGDALLFDFRTVHRSGPNDGAKRRAAISWRWLGDDAFWDPKPGADPIIQDQDTVLNAGELISDNKVFPLIHDN